MSERHELKTKRDRIVFLLDHYTDTLETMHQAESGGGDGDEVLLMPASYHHPSVVELRRAIGEARTVHPSAVAHMLAYYTAEWRNTDQAVTRRTKKGRITVNVRVRQRVLPRWLVREEIAVGVTAVTAAFRGEVFIPSEFMEAA